MNKMTNKKGFKKFRENVWKIVGGFLFFFIGMSLLNLKIRKRRE